MRRVRATGVETVFVLAGAQRRVRPVRPRAIHINEQKEETKMYAPHIAVATGLVDLDRGEGRVRRETTCWDLVFCPKTTMGLLKPHAPSSLYGLESSDVAAADPPRYPAEMGCCQAARYCGTCVQPIAFFQHTLLGKEERATRR